jgi:Gas vesicle synthesis protein GvpL/GvpF
VRATAGPADAAQHGLYVYGVVRASKADDDVAGEVRGVDPEGRILFVADGEVAALASVVSLAEFGDGAIEDNLHDPAWLTEKVRAHDAVLHGVLKNASLVPFRFGAIFRDEEQVRRMLRSQTRLPATLDRLDGTVELGVKGYVDAERFARSREPGEPDDPAAAGRAYLLRKQAERRLAEERRAFGAELAAAAHEELSSAAREARLNPIRSGDDGDMFLNGAYLVEEGETAAFRARVDELERTHASDGVRFEPTGPWPPYNFAGEDEPS